MGTYDVECEFDIIRRIGWSDEDLAVHIDDIFDRLQQADAVEGMSVEADLDTGRSNVSVKISTFDDEPSRVACAALGVAIRSCGAAHVGLLPLGDEATLRPAQSQWSALRIPTWHIRNIRLYLEPGQIGSKSILSQRHRLR